MMKAFTLAMVAAGIFLAVSFCGKNTLKAQAADEAGAVAKPKELVLDLGDKVTLKMLEIPAGKFMMGSPKNEKDREEDEGLPPDKFKGKLQIEVTISKPFYMGVYEVTVAQYAQFIKSTGQKHSEADFKQTGDHPVVNVSWEDAQAFCKWASKKSGKTVVLPTEAQWEYACRAGSKTAFYFGDKYEELGNYAWYGENSMDMANGMQMTHPVGQKMPNAWGLYDMHGNAWEWCADFFANYEGPGTDPTGPKEGNQRVMRGGCWNDVQFCCRTAYRAWINPGSRLGIFGFRVAVVAEDED